LTTETLVVDRLNAILHHERHPEAERDPSSVRSPSSVRHALGRHGLAELERAEPRRQGRPKKDDLSYAWAAARYVTLLGEGNSWSYMADVGVQANGRRKQTIRGGFRTRKAAEAALADVLSRLQAGAFCETTKLTLGAYLIDQWLPSMAGRVRPSTFDSYRRN